MGELRQVLELKGLRRADAQLLLEEQAAKGLAAGSGAAGGAAAPRAGGLMPSLRLGGGLAGLGDLGTGLREGLGELRSGLGGAKVPVVGGGSLLPDASRLQPAEAFRSAGRYLAQTGRAMKAGFVSCVPAVLP